MNVLIVDDKPENLYLLHTLLGAKGYDVSEAVNGKQALERARQAPPDLIISDILMPVMDGFALCRAWKRDGRLKSIPFVFYTATYTEPKDKEFALNLGADLFLVKPQETQVFLREIEKVLAVEGRQNQPAARLAEADEEDFHRQYNVRLVHKLEDKLEEIEQKNRALAAKERALCKANARLEERVVRRTQELEAVNKELEAFNYSVSHDLRAPLRHVDGFSQALKDEYANQLGEQGQDYLRRISKAVGHMAELIDGMLDLSRLNHGELVRGIVDLSALAETAVAKLQETKSAREIEVRIQPGVVVEGDRRLLSIVLDNLLNNAWKFTAKTTQPRIEFGTIERDGKTVCYVMDNGAGFDMNYADKLFGAFQRLHLAQEFPGIGIGLASVARSINRHGGRVWAEAEIDKGATFYFNLSN
jgi:signal transduction histidine kinase